MKLGISVKIDVTKIDKSRLFKGAKGTYLDLTTFVDTDNPGQYGDHGFISQSVSKDEKAAGVKTPILGNVKVFYQQGEDSQATSIAPSAPDFNDDIPFMRLEHVHCY